MICQPFPCVCCWVIFCSLWPSLAQFPSCLHWMHGNFLPGYFLESTFWLPWGCCGDDSSPGGRTEERARQVWFLSILVQSSKITLLMYNPGRQCLIPCSKTITTGLHHDTRVISRTLTWRNTQLIVMVWQSHSSTFHSPAKGPGALQAQQPDFTAAIWTQIHLQTWIGWVQVHIACCRFLLHSSQEHGISLSPVLLLATCAFSPGERWSLSQGEKKCK